MATKIIMPQLGESVVEGTVTRWLRKEGETIAEFESLLEVTTDKVETEIPSPATGTLLKILVPADTTVRAGTVLAWVGEPGETLDESPDPQAAHAAQAAPAALPTPVNLNRLPGATWASSRRWWPNWPPNTMWIFHV